MIPILYNKDEKKFDHNGLGQMVDILESTVEEVENGEFEFYGEYPVSGRLYNEITNSAFIKAKPNSIDEPHIFRIYGYELDIVSQTVIINASTITNDLGANMVRDVIINNETPQQAFNKIKKDLVEPTNFDFYSDIDTKSSTRWTRRNPLNCIAGEEGSLLQYWGGEIKRENNKISLLKRRGRDNVTTIRQDKNLTGLNVEYSAKGMATVIIPTYTYTPEKEGDEEQEPITLVGKTIESKYVNNYPIKYFKEVDYSQDEEVIDLASLNRRASNYFNENTGIDLPTMNMVVNIDDLSDSSEYEEFRSLENIELTDTVTVYIKEYGVLITAKVRRLVFDVLTEKNRELELGSVKATLYEDAARTTKNIIKETETELKNNIMFVTKSKNTVFSTSEQPTKNIVNGDLWYKPVGDGETEMYQFEGGVWKLILSTLDTTKVQREVEAAQAEAESAKQEAENAYTNAVTEAERLVDEQSEAFDVKFETETGTIRNEIEQGVTNAITDANSYTDAQKKVIDDKIILVEQEVSDVKDTTDKVAGEVNNAISDAGFTSLSETINNISEIATNVKSEIDMAVEGAGFTSLNDTLANTKHISDNANTNALKAIQDAEVAQTNALTAIGKADNASNGVLNLDLRVDEVEAEVALKADNSYLTEDGELITLSNAITVNATRFSSDMQRIESRVESLAGEINLVILKDAVVNSRLLGNETYPNPSVSSAYSSSETMREMITVVPGEKIALSKKTVSSDNYWRISFYSTSYVTRITADANEYILTVPENATKMWVSYPSGSAPQMVRGTTFVPYRPNLADQMTTDEMVLFRNEYDEFAEGTERRITAIDSEGGRLDIAEANISTNANNIQTTVGRLDGTEQRISTVEQTALGLQSTVASKADQSQVTQLSNAYNVLVRSKPTSIVENGDFSDSYNLWSFGTAISGATIYSSGRIQLTVAGNLDTTTNNVNRMWSNARLVKGKTYKITFDVLGSVAGQAISVGQVLSGNIQRVPLSTTLQSYEILYQADVDNSPFSVFFHRAGTYSIGNFVVVESTAVTKSQLTVLSDSISQSITGINGTLSTQQQTIDSISSTLQTVSEDISGHTTLINQTKSTVDSHTQTIATMRTDVDGKATITQYNTLKSTVDGTVVRVGDAEGNITQLETNVSGLQTTVASKADQSQVTQLSNAYNVLVRSKPTSIVQNGDFSNNYTGWSFGTAISGATIYSNGRVQLVVSGNLDTTTNNVNRVWSNDRLVKGKTYKITFDALGSVSGQAISIGQPLSSNIQRIPLSLTLQSYEVIYQADVDNSAFSVFFHRSGTYSIGNFVVVESTAVTKSQLSVLQDSINLRVEKGDVVSQINVEAGRTLISSGKILLDGDTYIMGTTFVNDIKAKSLEAVNADITNLRTKILTSDVITSTHLKVDNALVDTLTASTTVVDRFFSKTAVIDNLSVKTLSAITVNITSIRSQVLVTDAVTSTHLKSDTALIDKLFATTANINQLTSKTAFINNIKAIDISADRITAGTLNAADVNIINLNVSSIVGLNSTFVQSAWNGINTRINIDGTALTASDSTGNQAIINTSGEIRSTAGGTDQTRGVFHKGRLWFHTTSGSAVLNIGAHPVVGEGVNRGSIATARAEKLVIGRYNDYLNTNPNAKVNPYITLEYGATLGDESNAFTKVWHNLSMSGKFINDVQQVSGFELAVRATSGRLMLGVTGYNTLQVGQENTRSYGNMEMMPGYSVTGTSDERLKNSITPTSISGLKVVNALEYYDYYWNDRPEIGKQFGLIAQRSPFVSEQNGTSGYWGINMNKLSLVTAKAVKEVDTKVSRIDTYVTQHELEIKNLKLRIKQLEEK